MLAPALVSVLSGSACFSNQVNCWLNLPGCPRTPESESQTSHSYLLSCACSAVNSTPSQPKQQQKNAPQQTGKGRGKKILLPFQLAVLVGISITFTVVAGQSLHAFAGALTPTGHSAVGTWVYIIIFGGLQIMLSMVGVLGFKLLKRKGAGWLCCWQPHCSPRWLVAGVLNVQPEVWHSVQVQAAAQV